MRLNNPCTKLQKILSAGVIFIRIYVPISIYTVCYIVVVNSNSKSNKLLHSLICAQIHTNEIKQSKVITAAATIATNCTNSSAICSPVKYWYKTYPYPVITIKNDPISDVRVPLLELLLTAYCSCNCVSNLN